QLHKAFPCGSDFARNRSDRALLLKFVFQALTAQGVASIGMRRAATHIVPRTGTAVGQLLVRLLPRPYLDECVPPQCHMVGGDVGPIVPQLLLAGTVHFFEIMEI